MTELTFSLWGKMPGHGDFVARNTEPGFQQAIDRWLQQGIRDSHNALGEQWYDAYLNAPAAYFLECSEQNHLKLGVMLTSVDAVGRHYPLLCFVSVEDRDSSWQQMLGKIEWLEQVEELMLDALDNRSDADTLLEALAVTAKHFDQPSDPIAGQLAALDHSDEPIAASYQVWLLFDEDDTATIHYFSPLPGSEFFQLILEA